MTSIFSKRIISVLSEASVIQEKCIHYHKRLLLESAFHRNPKSQFNSSINT